MTKNNPTTSSSERYTRTAVVLHWIIALLIFVLIGLGWYMSDLPKGTPERAWFFNLHKSIGVVTGLVIAVRLVWRAMHVPPLFPTSMPQWQVLGARLSHGLLYVCMVLMPVSGFTASNFTKFGVKFFGHQLPILGWESKPIYQFFNETHVFTSDVLVAVIAVHVAAALWHRFKEKDGVFDRMLLK